MQIKIIRMRNMSRKIELVSVVEKAEKLARWRHKGQKDKYGNPYFEHLERVAQRVREMEYDFVDDTSDIELYVAAAYLHDVVEDGKATFAEISRLFGQEVYGIVKLLTRQEGDTYENYVMKIAKSGNISAMEVKIADNEDNLASVGDGAFPPEVEKKLCDRWLWSKDFLKRYIT